jgi:hypothetical protein
VRGAFADRHPTEGTDRRGSAAVAAVGQAAGVATDTDEDRWVEAQSRRETQRAQRFLDAHPAPPQDDSAA